MSTNSLDFKIYHHIAEVDPVSWNQLSAGRPFTSHQWYRYGETVMADALPTYLIAYQQDQPVARATFWEIKNEPVEIQSPLIKRAVEAIYLRWPMIICRSPLSGISGLILPEGDLRAAVQAEISNRAKALLKQRRGSFVIFDYLPKESCTGWPENFVTLTLAGPGTQMELIWPSFEAYLEAGNKKDRQHYKKTLREAEKLGIQVQRHNQIVRKDEAIKLIRGVEKRFHSAENPWAPAMLEHIGILSNATFLTATIGSRLVGCGLTLEDNGTQMNSLLGLADDVSYVYFMLIYESLKIAFEHHIQYVRLGSGAYEVKKQLGFMLEETNQTVFFSSNVLLQKLAQLEQ